MHTILIMSWEEISQTKDETPILVTTPVSGESSPDAFTDWTNVDIDHDSGSDMDVSKVDTNNIIDKMISPSPVPTTTEAKQTKSPCPSIQAQQIHQQETLSVPDINITATTSTIATQKGEDDHSTSNNGIKTIESAINSDQQEGEGKVEVNCLQLEGSPKHKQTHGRGDTGKHQHEGHWYTWNITQYDTMFFLLNLVVFGLLVPTLVVLYDEYLNLKEYGCLKTQEEQYKNENMQSDLHMLDNHWNDSTFLGGFGDSVDFDLLSFEQVIEYQTRVAAMEKAYQVIAQACYCVDLLLTLLFFSTIRFMFCLLSFCFCGMQWELLCEWVGKKYIVWKRFC